MTDIRDTRTKRLGKFEPKSFAAFEGRPVPSIKWLIPGVLAKGGVTLFSGQGGKGKSLLCMQLQAALATGQSWLGMDPLEEKIGSFGLYCEDEEEVLHYRMEAIRKAYGVSYSDLRLARFESRVGEQNELVRYSWKNDDGEMTGLYRQIRDELDNYGAQVLILDTAADVFGGNENFRKQVRTFVGLMRSLVIARGGGVIINSHPSRAGLTDGSGLSGSTAWEGSVRSRINLTEPKKEDADEASEQEPTNRRVLKVMKNNYGKSGSRWHLEFKDGLFVRADVAHTSDREKVDAKEKLLAAAHYLVGNGERLAANFSTRTSLTAKARTLPSCAKFSPPVLQWAQDELQKEGQLQTIDLGPASKRRRYIRPADIRYPDEPPSQGETLL